MTLPRPLKAAVNRKAHAEGQRYGEKVKSRLLTTLEQMMEDGATLAEMAAHVEGRGCKFSD